MAKSVPFPAEARSRVFPGIKLPVPGKPAAKAGAFYLRGTNRFPANEAGRMIT